MAPDLLLGPPALLGVPAHPAVDGGLPLGGQVPGPLGPERLLDAVEQAHGAGGAAGRPAEREGSGGGGGGRGRGGREGRGRGGEGDGGEEGFHRRGLWDVGVS